MRDARDFLLDPDRVALFDGAMGTMLYAQGVYINQCFDELTLRSPDLVREVHTAYVQAGAQVIETNTFGATRFKLGNYGLAHQVAALNERAAQLAREAAGERAWVAGAIGPLGIRLEPYGPTSLEEAQAAYREAAQALAAGGVDMFVLETFQDLAEILQAIAAVRSVSALPIIAQMTVNEDGLTAFGTEPAHFVKALDRAGADVIGLNCSVGPATMLSVLETMAGATQKKLSAQPNAGLPRDVMGRQIYMASPEYMAKHAKRLLASGARVIGGCCGTTPEHIRLMADALRAQTGGRIQLAPGQATAATGPLPAAGSLASLTPAETPLADRSRFAAKLAAGEFVTSVEIVPPKGSDATQLGEQARFLRTAGVDAINVPDGPRAQSRMSALAASLLIEREGIEAVVHYCCRDRNLLGMQSDLLGAAALGLRNLLLITGDPPKMGPYPQATAVFDIDAIGLTNLAKRLNQGLDLGGNPVGSQTSFLLGVGVNPGALDLEHELRRFHWKVEAGAQYAITQPVFDTAQLLRFIERIQAMGCQIPIIAGIWPLTSYRNAEFMSNEVPGVVVPPAILARMKAAPDAEAARQEGLAIAREMLAEVRGAIQGVQVSAPFGRVALALDVMRDVLPSPAHAAS
ncbi:MAG: bifunctional homocysteine S-methyltransferase/methylenetetrahydrofolate reductase [Candidatus Sericytochromatia bacterium]|nr:bifunctional homocysteine S-methyltransferase/methylenetetrahydrofolate reductase [Candidatus Sericytochromatia bacterium]